MQVGFWAASKTFGKTTAALGAVLALGFSAAAAADLNAPLKSSPPTIASEIRRGADGAGDCWLRRGEDLTGEAPLRCAEAAASANRQALRTNFEPFNAGLYFAMRKDLRILVGALETPPARFDTTLAKSSLDVAAAGYREAAAALGVTESQVCHAAYPKAQPGLCP